MGLARKLFYGPGCQWVARVAVNQQPEGEVWVHEGVGPAGWCQLKHSSGTEGTPAILEKCPPAAGILILCLLLKNQRETRNRSRTYKRGGKTQCHRRSCWAPSPVIVSTCAASTQCVPVGWASVRSRKHKSCKWE